MSTSNDSETGPPAENHATAEKEAKINTQSQSHSASTGEQENGTIVSITAGSQALHRKLRGPEVQMFAIGGAIGTSLYVQMGSALPKGGPAGLFLGFILWGLVMLCVNACFAEMITYLPVASPFVRLATELVDPALGFAMSWNFFLNMAFLVPFEIVALNIMLTFWTSAIPVEAVICVIIVLYALINCLDVKYFGATEFWASIFKVILILMMFCFTFVTMVGGNPQHDAYGFRYWKDPGAWVEHLLPGDLGRFLGLLSCIIQASFSICGPEYVSMVAAEAVHPRKVISTGFQSFRWRILVFFVGSALCMGIVIPYNDPTLAAILSGTQTGSGTAAASPYIIAMQRLSIPFLPHLANAMIITSIFSSGNGLLFAATRTLHGMALAGHTPHFLSRCTKQGVPIFALLAALSFCLLAFLQVSASSAQVLTWLVDLVTCCQLINYSMTALTYLHFYVTLRRQGISRELLPYKSWFQPYTAIIALIFPIIVAFLLGYDLFLDGGWDLKWFFLDYSMIGFFIVALVGYKVVFRTRYRRPGSADLSLGGLREEIDAYEAFYSEEGRKGRRLLGWLFG